MRFDQALLVYGDQKYRNKKCPKEGAEQVTFFNELRARYPKTIGKLATHIKNEGKRTANQAAWDKANGMTNGASDIIIPARMPFVCELKRLDHTLCAWRDGQEKYLLLAQDLGAFSCVALGHEAALQAVEDWLHAAGLQVRT